MPTHSLYLTTSLIPYSVGSVLAPSILGIESQPVYTAISVPSAPLLLNILTTDSQILVVFAPNNPGESSIITDYQYSIDGGNTFITMVTLISIINNYGYLITNLINGVTYQVQVKALNAIGQGSTSNIISATPSTTPSAVIINSVSAGDGKAFVDVTINNNGGSAITNYKYSIDNGVTFTSFSPAQTTNPLTITGLTNGNTYNIVVKAVNFRGDGLASNSQAVTLIVNLINQYTTSIWLDTTTPSSNYVLNGSNVTSWLDKTSNNFNLTNNGTITYNSISPTYVSIPAFTYFKQINFNLTYLQTWCFVVSFPTTLSSGVTRIVGMNTTDGSYGFQFSLINGSKFLINNFAGSSLDGIYFNYSFNTNTKYLFSISLNLNTSLTHSQAIVNSILRLNGTTQTLASTNNNKSSFVLTPTGATTALLIGAVANNATYYITEKPYYIHEMIGINNQALGINDIQTLETYMNSKWNLGYTIT